MTVLCAGHVNWDVTLRVDHLPEPDGEVAVEERVQRGGGSAANVAAGLAGLDTPAALFGSVGDDESGTKAIEELETAGVETDRIRAVPGAETAVKYLVVDHEGEVMVLSNAGANESFTAEHLTGGFDGIDHLHLTSQLPETAAELAERAHEAGVSVSFDPGRRLGDRSYAETLRHVDLLFLNAKEAVAMIESELDDALPQAASVVIKLGEEGAELRGPTVVRHGGFAVDPLDTTGAGDAFAAGFLAEVEEAGGLDAVDTEDALGTANACGAVAAMETGARVKLSWARLQQFEQRH
jgi:ribokinase